MGIKANKIKDNILQYSYLIFVMLCMSFFIILEKSPPVTIQDDVVCCDSWQDPSGNQTSIDKLGKGNVTLSMDTSKLELSGRAFCFKTVDTLVTVYADDKKIYDFHPVQSKVMGKSYGMYVHTVYIPSETKELRMEIEPVFDGGTGTVRDAMLEDSGKYMSNTYKNGLAPFVRSTLTLLIGLFFIVIAIGGGILSRFAGIDFMSFGLMCFLLGFTGLNDTYVLQIITQNPALIRFLTYICLMFLPYPALAFFASAAGVRHSKLLNLMAIASICNFVLSVTLTVLGISDYYYMVNVSHVIIGIDFIACLYMVGHAMVKHKIRAELVRSLIVGLLFCISGALIDIINYHVSARGSYTTYSRIGVILFMFIMGYYLLKEQIRTLKLKQEEDRIYIRETTEAFAKIIDMKDTYTNGHSSRVAKYTAMLAKELGYDEETVEKYYRIALLHDIGKVGIPKEVLNKPGRLTEEEYELIKSHAEKGYDALKDISIMPELAIGAGSHHERPDGKGYPKGLKGDEIPRVAQIIAVADCFDAMYSDRPYRKCLPFDKVVATIREISGTQLTEDVVEAFLRLVEKGELR